MSEYDFPSLFGYLLEVKRGIHWYPFRYDVQTGPDATFYPAPSLPEDRAVRAWKALALAENLVTYGSREEEDGIELQLTPRGKQYVALFLKPQWHGMLGDSSEIEEVRYSLSDSEYKVLQALREAAPRQLLFADLAAVADISEKTCGKIVRRLVFRDLALRPSARAGVTITDSGRKVLSSADRPRAYRLMTS